MVDPLSTSVVRRGWREGVVAPMLRKPWIVETDPDKAGFIIETQRWRCAKNKPVLLIDEVKRFDRAFAWVYPADRMLDERSTVEPIVGWAKAHAERAVPPYPCGRGRQEKDEWARRGAVNRDRGDPRGSAPPTPPYIRVRILLDALHHPLARPLAAHIDVAVVGVAIKGFWALGPQ